MSNVTRPNLVYILNDDTDVLLGAASTLRQTRALLGVAGATFTEFRTLSPKCTPSRTGQLVGRLARTHGISSVFVAPDGQRPDQERQLVAALRSRGLQVCAACDRTPSCSSRRAAGGTR